MRQRNRAARIRIANRQVKRLVQFSHPRVPRQTLRSSRKRQLHAMRAARQRGREERDSAAAGLWDDVHQSRSSGNPDKDIGAWPRLQKRQRDGLATEVEAFVMGSR